MYKVLIAEDQVAIRMMIKKIIQDKLGHKAVEAENGLEALELVQKENPDLLISDISMPIMDGLELLQSIREDATYKDLPAIILTGQKEKETIERILELGVLAYLLKPIEYSKFIPVLEKAFEDLKKGVKFKRTNSDGGKNKIAVIDKNEELNKIFDKDFDKKYEIDFYQNPKDAFESIHESSPKYVFIKEGQGIINETILAKKIKNLDKENFTKIILCLDQKKKVEGEELFDKIFDLSTQTEEIFNFISE